VKLDPRTWFRREGTPEPAFPHDAPANALFCRVRTVVYGDGREVTGHSICNEGTWPVSTEDAVVVKDTGHYVER
jgi:hypothetical protein